MKSIVKKSIVGSSINYSMEIEINDDAIMNMGIKDIPDFVKLIALGIKELKNVEFENYKGGLVENDKIQISITGKKSKDNTLYEWMVKNINLIGMEFLSISDDFNLVNIMKIITHSIINFLIVEYHAENGFYITITTQTLLISIKPVSINLYEISKPITNTLNTLK